MKPNYLLREEATHRLEGKWGQMALITLVFYIIEQIISGTVTAPLNIAELSYNLSGEADPNFLMKAIGTTGILVLISFILLIPLTWGYIIIFLNLYREEKTDISQIFDGFKKFKQVVFTTVLTNIYTFLWMLLFIIPGIIKSYSYAMTPYIIKDRPDLSYDEAIEESMRMMDGYKWKLFFLHLSFLGWYILAILTCGIGMLLLCPYFMTAQAAFYEDRKAELYPETIKEEPMAEQEVVVDEPVKEEVAQEKVVAEPANLKNEGHYDKG